MADMEEVVGVIRHGLEGVHCYGPMLAPHAAWVPSLGARATVRAALQNAHSLVEKGYLAELMADYGERYVRICVAHSEVFEGEFCSSCGELRAWYVGDSWSGRLICLIPRPDGEGIIKATGRFLWGKTKAG